MQASLGGTAPSHMQASLEGAAPSHMQASLEGAHGIPVGYRQHVATIPHVHHHKVAVPMVDGQHLQGQGEGGTHAWPHSDGQHLQGQGEGGARSHTGLSATYQGANPEPLQPPLPPCPSTLSP